MASWYYADGQRQVGPFSEESFQDLVADGTVRPETLVWRDGMTDWRPYAETAANTPGTNGVVCSLCHNVVPAGDAIQYQGAYVCAACKPEFVQRIKEGIPMPGMIYAPFWTRFAAWLVDSLIMMSVGCGLGVGFVLVMMPMSDVVGAEGIPALFQIALNFAATLVQLSYHTILVGRFGATPGKMILGLKVVRPDGGRVSYMRAFARYWATVLSNLTCMIGYVIAGFDEEHRALHDHICSTRVILATQESPARTA